MRRFEFKERTGKKALNAFEFNHRGNSFFKSASISPYQETPLYPFSFFLNRKHCSASRSWDLGQGRKPFPGIDKVFPPTMKDRDLQANLPSSVSNFCGYQTNASPYPFHMLFAKRRRKDQIPDPQGQIIGQLSTQKISPVGHKGSHGQMRQKLVGKLAYPLLLDLCITMPRQDKEEGNK